MAMRALWFLLVAAVSMVAGIGIGKWIDTKYIPPKPSVPGQPVPPRGEFRMRPGYVEIPDATQYACTGTPNGMIRVRLSHVLKNLHESKTVNRDVALLRVRNAEPERNFLGMQLEPLDNPNVQTGFPTQLDFSTGIRLADGDRLVEPVRDDPTTGKKIAGKFVIVRVILDKDDGTVFDETGAQQVAKPVEFLRPLQGNREDSGFAIMRSASTNSAMFCARQPIKTETVAGRDLEYVDFGVQSTGKAEWGSFGIGLMVHDPKEPFVIPMILDPLIKNEG